MPAASTILERTDWASLAHAYGSASDAPIRLQRLLAKDPDSCTDALEYLDGAILHQGTIYSATAPTATFVAAILDDPRTLVVCGGSLPYDISCSLRVQLLHWIGHVAEATANADKPSQRANEIRAALARLGIPSPIRDHDAIAACREMRVDIFDKVAPFLADSDPDTREAAMTAGMHLLLAPELEARRNDVGEALLRATDSASPQERATVALVIGSWGTAPRQQLTDPHPGVRACAALAIGFDGDPDALAEVRRALTDPAAADGWFETTPSPLRGHLRFSLVAALLRRTTTFDEIVDEAVAIARVTNAYCVDADWGPLLERAFIRRLGKRALSPAQRRFLVALVDNEQCWRDCGNPEYWFIKVGLAWDREQVRRITERDRRANGP